jgi:hypothetical protein
VGGEVLEGVADAFGDVLGGLVVDFDQHPEPG